MEYIICSLCSLLCFICGAWVARGAPIPCRREKKPDPAWSEADDTLSRDIAAMLAYTGPDKEDDTHENP